MSYREEMEQHEDGSSHSAVNDDAVTAAAVAAAAADVATSFSSSLKGEKKKKRRKQEPIIVDSDESKDDDDDEGATERGDDASGASEPRHFYLENFTSILLFADSEARDLLAPEELAMIDAFQQCELSGRRLFVRLFNRKGPFFRCTRQCEQYAVKEGLDWRAAREQAMKAGLLVDVMREIFPSLMGAMGEQDLGEHNHDCDDHLLWQRAQFVANIARVLSAQECREMLGSDLASAKTMKKAAVMEQLMAQAWTGEPAGAQFPRRHILAAVRGSTDAVAAAAAAVDGDDVDGDFVALSGPIVRFFRRLVRLFYLSVQMDEPTAAVSFSPSSAPHTLVPQEQPALDLLVLIGMGRLKFVDYEKASGGGGGGGGTVFRHRDDWLAWEDALLVHRDVGASLERGDFQRVCRLLMVALAHVSVYADAERGDPLLAAAPGSRFGGGIVQGRPALADSVQRLLDKGGDTLWAAVVSGPGRRAGGGPVRVAPLSALPMPAAVRQPHTPPGALSHCMRRFSALSVCCSAVALVVDWLETVQIYRAGLLCYRLMISAPVRPSRRGRWFARAAVNFEHAGMRGEALAVCEAGLALAGPDRLREHYRWALSERARRLAKPPLRWRVPRACLDPLCKPKVRVFAGRLVSKRSRKREQEEEEEEEEEKEEKEEEAAAASVSKNAAPATSGSLVRNYFQSLTGPDAVTVEQFALEHYAKDGGWSGVHDEGGVLRSLFALLFWDAWWSSGSAPCHDVFCTPFQSGPLDLGTPEFYEHRRPLIDGLLQWIGAPGTMDQVCECVVDRWREHEGKSVRGLNWDTRSVEQLCAVARGLGGPTLAAVMRLFASGVLPGGGLPDLTLWKVAVTEPGAGAAALFSEVKGPGDRLSDKQRIWIDRLLVSGANVELCKVEKK